MVFASSSGAPGRGLDGTVDALAENQGSVSVIDGAVAVIEGATSTFFSGVREISVRGRSSARPQAAMSSQGAMHSNVREAMPDERRRAGHDSTRRGSRCLDARQ